MVVALGIVAAVLAVVAVVLLARLNKANERAATTEAARAALATERDGLRQQVGKREAEVRAARRGGSTFRPLVEEAGDCVWEADVAGVITFSNPAGAVLL